MSLFNTRVTALNAQLESLKAALATIGFDPALLEKDPQALAAHVSTLTAQEDAATTASIEKLNTDLATAKTSATAFQNLFEGVTGAMKRAGVDISAAHTAPDVEAYVTEAIDAAIAAKATTQAAAQVALAGHAPLTLPQGGADAPTAATAPATAEEFLSIYGSIKNAAERTAYYRKFSAKFSRS